MDREGFRNRMKQYKLAREENPGLKYYDFMERLAEFKAKEWNDDPDMVLQHMLNDNSYNYQQMYEDNPNFDIQEGHFVDTYKTAYHPTFSEESMYSGKKSPYNPEGIIGGSWDESTKSFYLNDKRQSKRKAQDYLNRADPGYKAIPKYDEGIGSVGMPSTTSVDGRTKYVYYDPTMDLEYQNINLPEVTITGNKNKGKRLPMQVPEGSYERFKTLGEVGKTVGSFLPVAGEMIDAYDLVNDVQNKNWMSAAVRTAGYVVPNAIEKFGGTVYKGIRNNWRRFKRNLKINDGWRDSSFDKLRYGSLSDEITRKQLNKEGIQRWNLVPLFSKKDFENIDRAYKAAVSKNEMSALDAFDQFINNHPEYDKHKLNEIFKLFEEDPRYADFIATHPELDPLSPGTVDQFITKQNSFIRGVYSEVDDDSLIEKMLTHNASERSNKRGGDRLGTNVTGIYVSNSGEIADRFQRNFGSAARSDIGFLQKSPATDINVSIRERLAAERRRIFPFDIVPVGNAISYDKLVDLGYVAKESQYTTRYGNKLPGYERAYISDLLDTPTLTIKDLKTTRGNLDDKKGRWGIGGVNSMPELEDKLFDGLNIGRSFGDYVHLMKNLSSQKLTRQEYNPYFDTQRHKLDAKIRSNFNNQFEKRQHLVDKVVGNPVLSTINAIDPQFAGVLTGGVTFLGTLFNVVNDDIKARNRLSAAYEDDEFKKWVEKSPIPPDDYSSNVDYIDALMNEWNKNNPNNKYAEGGEVTGPPTYELWYDDITQYNPTILDNASLYWSLEAAKKDLHKQAMGLPGYAPMWHEYVRSLPKADPDINQFVDDLWANENPNNAGYRNGKYYPHKSPEGGKMTIGPGFKLDSGSHGISTKTANRGMTKTRLDQEARKIGKQHLKAVDQFINYGQTTNPADTVSPQIKMGLMDLRHLVGPLNEWGNLRQAVLEGDLDRIRKESTVTWNDNGKTKVDKRRKKIRDEKYFHYAEGGQVEPDPLDVLEASRPKVAGIPINDKPLSGTDPIGEAMMWGLGGGAASAALRSLFPTYGATAAWLAFGGNNKDNMLVIPNNPTKNTTPIETGLLNKEVRQYYADDVLPRDILTSETDKLKFLNTDKNFEYDLYPQGYFANGVVGHYDRMNDVIRLNGGYVTDKDLLDNVMSHEVNHRYNREFPLDKEHTRILNRVYTVEPKLNTAAARAARKESEKRATNVNIRHKLQTDLRNTLGRKPTKAEMDEFIDSLSDLELLDRLGSASSYGSAYLMSIEERSDLVNQPADQYKKARVTGLRKALKRIAMNENKNDNNQNYA